MACLQRGPTEIRECASFQEAVVVSLSKSKTCAKILIRLGNMPLHDCRDAPDAEHLSAGGVVFSLAEALSLRKSLIRFRELSLAGECFGLCCQFMDDIFWTVGIELIASKELQGVVIHPAPHHCIGLQKLEFCGPVRTGNPKPAITLLSFLLTHSQVAVVIGRYRMVIRSLRVAGVCVFKRK